MQLELKNIGMIKEATVKIDGLTVIAGENDTGKSTVGKVLYSCMKSLNDPRETNKPEDDNRPQSFNRYIQNLFNNQISENGDIELFYDDTPLSIKIEENRSTSYKSNEYKKYPPINQPILIETPMIWTIFPLIKTVRGVKLESFFSNIDFQILPTIEDLYFALTIKMIERKKTSLNIDSIIGGTFRDEDLGDYKFHKKDTVIELSNTATGIKQFGILQVLNDNNHLQDGQILIMDEPEVHLHPEWQLKMAEIIVKLVKNGVKIVVNSHSPYMIEALELYTKKEKIKSNFYLAEKKDEYAIISDVTSNLEPIYAKLAKSIQTLEEQSLENFEW